MQMAQQGATGTDGSGLGNTSTGGLGNTSTGGLGQTSNTSYGTTGTGVGGATGVDGYQNTTPTGLDSAGYNSAEYGASLR